MTVTQADVAKRAGVSRQLVSLVVRGDPHVSDARRRAVQRAMRELNYRPNAVARALAEKRSNILGILLPSVANPYFGNIVEHLRAPALANNLSPLVSFGQEDPRLEREVIERFLEINVTGLVMVSPLLDERDLLAASEVVPVTTLASEPVGNAVDVVVTDNRRGGQIACEHALSCGYEQVVFVGQSTLLDGPSSDQRRLGYLDAMEAAGRSENALTVTACNQINQTLDEIFDYFNTTNCAIVAMNDLVAVEIITQLHRRGLRPGLDVGVTGYDNTYLAQMNGFEITSVDQHYSQIAHSAIEMILTRREDPKLAGRHKVITPSLVRRASTRRRVWSGPSQ